MPLYELLDRIDYQQGEKLIMKLCLYISFLFWGVSAFTLRGGEECLFRKGEIVGTNKALELTVNPIPVVPQKKYGIEFTASTTGEYTIEENERIRIMRKEGKANCIQMVFYDKNQKTCSKTDLYILSGKLKKYVRIFYPSAKAAFLRIFTRPLKGTEIAVSEIHVRTDLEGKEGECINPHTTFDYGDLNSYGYHCGGGGRFYMRPDGKTVWNTGFIGYSPFFPVQAECFYRIFCRGRKSQDKGWIWINFYKDDDEIIKHATINVSAQGAMTMLKMPKEAVRARLQCYYLIIEEITVLPESIKTNRGNQNVRSK